MATMIKFRAWDKATSSYRKVLEIEFYPDGELKKVKVTGLQRKGTITPDNLVLEQFTGLTDVNGKDIYEGDIIEVTSQYWGMLGNRYEVKFEQGAFYVKYGLLSEISPSISVIGNVHEKPELLEKKK
ncbi:YopX family protein [Lactiplantibacillus plantarum]|uniref:YopX family protein n=2 Tax=Lactiplantibacillus plantarum TaxID=1590 RepID=UPI000629E860|nr:YopX family protein [Lactiplantibacillus plantarum]